MYRALPVQVAFADSGVAGRPECPLSLCVEALFRFAVRTDTQSISYIDFSSGFGVYKCGFYTFRGKNTMKHKLSIFSY